MKHLMVLVLATNDNNRNINKKKFETTCYVIKTLNFVTLTACGFSVYFETRGFFVESPSNCNVETTWIRKPGKQNLINFSSIWKVGVKFRRNEMNSKWVAYLKSLLKARNPQLNVNSKASLSLKFSLSSSFVWNYFYFVLNTFLYSFFN